MSVMFCGTGKDLMEEMKSGDGCIPESVTLNPKKSTSLDPNWNLLGLNVHPPCAPRSRNSHVL